MAHYKCSICKQDIVLVPSAEQRAKKYGETAEYYRSLFVSHVSCQLDHRKRSVLELMKRISSNGHA